MYKLPETASKVIELYNSFDWKQVVQIPISKIDLQSNKIKINSEMITHFGSSGYMGLHKDSRVIEAGIEAIREYGAIMCSTRAFTYLDLTDQFETMLQNIFGLPTMATIQTINAHFSAMQLLMLPTDAAIIDMQAHATLHNMILIPKAQGMQVDAILHNNLEQLERKIIKFQNEGKEKIWYVADGVYSMFGDVAPINDLLFLLEKYENFYVYFDDAHGMSWAGPNGAGYIWKYLPIGHPKVILATSLGKGFGIGGGALVCPNAEVKSWMTRASATAVFTTQLPSQMLGSGIASARIHLSNEIYIKQDKIKLNIDTFIRKAKSLNLPFIDYSETPVFYMSVGKHDFAVALNQMVRERGYYTNIGSYPAVPYKNAGIRISITSDHTIAEIIGLLDTIAECMDTIMKEKNISLEEITSTIERTKQKSMA